MGQGTLLNRVVVLPIVLTKPILMTHVKYRTNKAVWTVEDLTELVVFASTNKRDVLAYIKDNKEKFDKAGHIVCKYPSTRSLIPEDVKTVKQFILENKLKSKSWRPITSLMKNLIGA